MVLNEIYNMNCMELFTFLEPESIDLCIADPPYGINFQSNVRSVKFDKILNDTFPYTEWIFPLFNILKNGGRLILFYRWDVQEYFYKSLIDAGFIIKNQLVWNKDVHSRGDLSGSPSNSHELMLFATKGRFEFSKKRPKSVYTYKRVNTKYQIHPNEKPIDLITNIINDYTIDNNDVILDPFGGSFVTFISAINNGYRAISSELDTKYFNIGKDNVAKKLINSKSRNLF